MASEVSLEAFDEIYAAWCRKVNAGVEATERYLNQIPEQRIVPPEADPLYLAASAAHQQAVQRLKFLQED